jgi:hypothetical protein
LLSRKAPPLRIRAAAPLPPRSRPARKSTAISKSEADAAGLKHLSKNFDAIDTNHDGNISRAEMKAYRKARKAAKAGSAPVAPSPSSPAVVPAR